MKMCYLFMKRATDATGFSSCWRVWQTHVQTHEISLLDCPTNIEKRIAVSDSMYVPVIVCVCVSVSVCVCVWVTVAT